jgi:fibronectin-binding autotransporter adhesin
VSSMVRSIGMRRLGSGLWGGVLLLALASTAHAQQSLTWSPAGVNSGGSGTWNTVGAVWANGATCCQPWNNTAAPTNDAVFGGTAGTVTVSGTINVHHILFNTSGYNFTGGTLTLQGVTPTITANAGVTTTLGSVIAGTVGLGKAGAGTTILTGTNTYSGGTTIGAGTLQIGNGGTAGTLGSGAVLNTGSLVFNRSNALSVANAIGGTGAVTQSGAGTTTLTGGNTYTGTTTISAGTLQIGGGGTVGTLGTGDVVNNATLSFNRSDTLAVANAISGSGNLSKAGAGTTILTGSNSYAGTTTISAGTLQVGDGGSTGAIGGGAVVNNAALSFNRSDVITVANAISGSGRIEQAGAGTTVLTGANAYTGTTTISAGTLQVGDGGGTGSLGTGAVTNNATLIFNRDNALTVANAISGSGAVSQSGTGTTILTGANTYTGTTTITAGTLQVGSGGTTGTLGTGAVVNNGTLAFNRSNALTVANAIGGTGAVTKSGAGTTTLTGANTYSGTTTISAGTLQIGSGGTTGSLGSGAVVNNAALSFNRSDTLTVANAISGSGNVSKAGAGTMIVTGSNSYVGTTTISAGTLQVGDGGSTGTLGAGAVVDNAALVFNRSDTLAVTNAISGTGQVNQVGAGTTILTGANTYTGATTIGGGTLQVGNGGATGSLGTGVVTNNAAVVFNRNNSLTVANAIGGSGGLGQAGVGTTILTGANTYAGTTTIALGTLQVGSGSTTGTLGTGAVVNDGTLAINRSNAMTVANAISGTGAVTKSGAGTTTLTGDNSYGGTTTIAAGTLQIGSGGTTGSLGTGNVVNNATLAFNRSDTLTVVNAISGTGAVTKSGSGTAIFTADNTYAGATTISTGVLQVGDGGATGTLGAGAVVNNAALVFNRGNTLAVGGAISGTGQVNQAGTGTTVLTGANTYSGTTTIGAGTLQVGNGGTTGSLGTGAVLNNAALAFNRSNALTVANAIGGTGAVTKDGAGTTTFTGANTYSGTTTINAGTLQIGSGSTSGSLGAGAVVNNATLAFNRSNTLTVANAIGGSGAVTKAGSGTTIFTGENTYAGTTTISAGTLQIGSGGTTGWLGAGAVVNNAALAFSRSDDFTVGNAIGGSGALRQIGTGTMTITGANTYTGTTTISGGTLQVGDGGASGTLGTGAVVNNAALIFNRSNALAVGGVISGSGQITQAGTGTTILTGANTYSGTTTIGAGVLQIGNGGTTGALGSGAVINDATLAFNRSNTFTVANAIGGSGALVQQGTGTTTLTGANSYSGTTTIAAGTLQIGSGSTTGTLGTGAVVNNGMLTFNRSNTFTVGNSIGGSGAVTKAGSGTTIFTGTNTFAGTTTISAGTLQLGDGGASGTLGTGAIVNSGTLTVNRSDALTLNAMSGSGQLVQAGTGTTILAADNTYSGTTTIAAGTLQVGNGGTLGSLGTGAVTNTGRLRFNRSDTLTVGNAISGAGEVAQDGPGTTILTGTNTYSGQTTINAGTLQIGNGGTSGSIGDGAIVTAGTLSLNRSDTVTFANAISGSGGLINAGPGTTILTGANSYTGSTTMAAGILQVGNGGTTGTLGLGDVANNATLVFNRSDAVSVAGDISGSGVLEQVGSGTTILRGNNTYTGGTAITAGTLELGDGGVRGGLIGNVVNGSVLSFNRADTMLIAGEISGSGAVNQIGSGTTILAGANSYSGPTTISAGTLQIGNGGTTGQLGSGPLVNNGTLAFSRSDTLTLANTISGSGGLKQVGPGTLILAADNIYSGATTITGGTLQVGTGSTAGQLGLGAVTNHGVLAFNRSDLVTVGNDISGTGLLRQMGPGTLVLIGGNSYTGGTTIEGSTLQVGNGGLTGSLGSGAVANNGNLIVNRSGLLQLSGNISGTGALQQIGPGTTVLAGTNTYGGGTTVGAGMLQIGNGGTSGSLTGDVRNESRLVFNRSDAVTFGGTISGTGAFVQSGSGTTILTGVNTYTGTTIIERGTLQVGNGGTTGQIGSGALVNNGTLAFNRSDMLTVASDLSGAGALKQMGPGTLVLTGANSYAGGTTIEGGTLQLGDGGTSGSLVGDVHNDSVLAFNRRDSVSFDGVVTGSGHLYQIGPGTTILTGANTYAGTTAIGGGTLQVGNGATTGQLGSGAIINHGTLVFDRSDVVAVHSPIAGSGNLVQAGSGTLSLSGVHAFTGATQVRAGTLRLDGILAGSVDVGAGATFSANGSIGGALAVNGTVAVVGSDGDHGELTVGGNLTLGPGSRGQVTIDALGGHSQLLAGGAAFVDGSSFAVAAAEGSYNRVSFYPFLYAVGGVSGTAAATTSSSTLAPTLTASGQSLVLTVLNTALPLAPVATTNSGAAVAAAFDRLRPAATGDLAFVIRELTALDDSALSTALDATAGEIHASTTLLAAIDGETATNVVRQELAVRGASEIGTAAAHRRLSGARFWGRFHGEETSVASGSAHGADTRLSGFVAGADRMLSHDWFIGGGAGYSSGDLTLDSLGDSTTYSTPRGFGYVGYSGSHWLVHGGASIARNAYDVRRTLTFAATLPVSLGGGPIFGGVDRRAATRLTGLATELWGDWVFVGRIGQWDIRPGAGLRYARYGRNAATESGADSLSLKSPDQTTSSRQGTVAVSAGRSLGRFGLRSSVGYQRELSDGRLTTLLHLSDASAGAFTVDGPSLARNIFTAAAGATIRLRGVQLSLGYEARRARAETRQGIQLGMRF